jgi:hypothetical protein
MDLGATSFTLAAMPSIAFRADTSSFSALVILARESGKAGITCVTKELYPVARAHDSRADSNTTEYFWSGSTSRTYCNETLYNGFEPELTAVIKQVKKLSWKTTTFDKEETDDYCWLLGAGEVGGSGPTGSPKYSQIFKNNASRKRSYNGTVVVWNLRDERATKTNYYVKTDGTVSYGTGQNTSRRFLFGFCI